MNWKKLFIGILGFHVAAEDKSTTAFTEINQKEINSLISMVNTARSKVVVSAYAMPKVTWNYNLAKDLQEAVKNMPTDWWFGGEHQPEARYNSQLLMRYAPFNTSYPNYDFMIHDGCQSTNNGVSRIFWMRAISQAKFFKYQSCSDTVINRNWGYINSYFSCAGIDRNNTKLVSNESWSWMWQYYPKIVNDDMEDFACMLLGHSGPNAAGGSRPNHFFCYWGHKSHSQVSEKPYTAIKNDEQPGEGCPGKVIKRLCV